MFRWAAFFTFLTGLLLLEIILAAISLDIILGAVMGTIMMLNVWGIIWPNQKIVIGIKEGDAAIAGPKAALASRTNTLLSLPMLFFMVSSSHNQLGGNLWSEQITLTAFVTGLGLILLIEANSIWGKMFGVITSVRNVIVSSFVLTIMFSSIAYYL